MRGTGRDLCCRLPRWGASLAGCLAVTLAVTAAALGIDKDAGWGPRRQVLLLVGLLLLAVAQWSSIERGVGRLRYRLSRTRIGRWTAQLVRSPQGAGSGGRVDEPAPPISDQPKWAVGRRPLNRWQWVVILITVLLVELIYVWFSSVGYWTTWPKGTSHYDLLAQGFLHGRTSLLVEPDPRLLELEDPYSMEGRGEIPVLWDVSYFEGKYFLYWGPAPAAFLAVPKALLEIEISDSAVTFAAASMILAASTLILLALWNRFFASQVSFWLLPAGVFLVGLGPPLLWSLGNSNVYEAAVSSGMAAFLAAVGLALPLLASEPVPPGRLVLTGLFLGLAVASRLALGPATLLLLGVLLSQLIRRRRSWRAFALDAASLLSPMAITGLLLGWYNLDRFGSLLETGFQYQLTGRPGELQDLFDARYLIPNTYNYMLRQFRTLSVFPFIKPILGVEAVPFLPVNIHPAMYTTQFVSGSIATFPATLWAFLLAWWVVCGKACQWAGLEATETGRRLRALAIVLVALTVVAFLPTGAYHWAANRFQMDFMPLATILSVAGAWLATGRQRTGLSRFLLRVVVAASFLVSIFMAGLLAISADAFRFEKLNPELFEWITRLLA